LTDYVGANFDVGEAVGPEAVVVTCRAGGAISKGVFVKLSDGQDFTVVTATAGSTVYGAAMRAAAAAGEYIPVCAFGRVKMTAGAAVTAGNRVESNASGLPQNVTTGEVAGRAVQSGVANDQIVIFVGRA